MRDALPERVSQPVALIVPHAGYIFSGQIAADGFRQAAAAPVDVVVILGTNHTSGTFRRISVYDGEGYRTPLGVARVDREIAAALVKDGGGVFDATLHEREHSVEVQVPFVQHVFPGAAIVPVVVGAPDPEACRRFGRALAALAAGRRMLIVASSDLSHYPARQVAAEVDRRTLAAVAALDADALDGLRAQSANLDGRGVDTGACGEGPIRVAIEAARALGALRGTVVSYANSGDTAVGDPERVVGYGSVAFSRGEPGADLCRAPARARGCRARSRRGRQEGVAASRARDDRALPRDGHRAAAARRVARAPARIGGVCHPQVPRPVAGLHRTDPAGRTADPARRHARAGFGLQGQALQARGRSRTGRPRRGSVGAHARSRVSPGRTPSSRAATASC